MRRLRYICLLATLALSPSVHAGAWVDDWLSSATKTPSGSFSGQQRNYYTGGSYSARWRTTVDNPVSINYPSIKAGCGGIDVFKGGMSLADPEYLVSKFQSMIQAAPAVAFDIALKTMSKDLSETMKSITATIDTLNGLQLNDCAMAKRAVVAIKDNKDVSGIASDVWNEVSGDESLKQTLTKNWQNHSEQVNASGGKSDVPLSNKTAGCSADFKAIFVNGGSVIGNVSTLIGITDYADMLRGYIGDLWIAFNPATNKYDITPIQDCRGNTKQGPDDFLMGDSQARQSGIGGACYKSTSTSMATYVDTTLHSIASKMATKTALSSTEKTFIDSTNHEVYLALKAAIANQTVDATIGLLRQPIAHQMANRAMDDLFLAADKAIDVAQRGAYQAGTSRDCNIEVLAPAIQPLTDFRRTIFEARAAAAAAYANSLKELSVSVQIAEKHWKDLRTQQGDLARKLRRQ